MKNRYRMYIREKHSGGKIFGLRTTELESVRASTRKTGQKQSVYLTSKTNRITSRAFTSKWRERISRK